MIKNKLFLFLLLCFLVLSSCDDFFSVETESLLTNEENYKGRNQVYSGMLGLATNLRAIMDDYIVLSELRGDLLQPTETAPDEYWDIFRYKSDANNSVASPAPLYQLVANSNDFLRSLRQYQKSNPDALNGSTYRGMVAAAISYRAWAYLNIGKLYGEAYYHDLSVFDMNQDMSQGKLLSLDDLIKQLISSMQNGIDNINAFNYLDWRPIVMDPSAESDKFDQTWSRITINPDALLTELFLWDGNYIDAAKQGILAIKGQGLYSTVFNLTQYSEDKWKDLFRIDFGNTHLNEAMTAIQFNYAKRQTHSLQYYFSNYAPNIYRFRPTDLFNEDLSDYLYRIPNTPIYVEEEDLEEGQEGVIRFVSWREDERRKDVSVGEENGMPVVSKYSLNRLSHEHDATIYVYRASELYLMIAEALNGIGGKENIAAADSLVSIGFAPSWVSKDNAFKAPFDAPIYAGKNLSASKGVLGRLGYKGNFTRYYIPKYNNLTESELLKRQQFVMDSIIAQETARELAFEGKRWFTLVRMARNSNLPEKLANVVIKKFPYSLQDHYRVWLMEPKNWFLKWNHSPADISVKGEEVK